MSEKNRLSAVDAIMQRRTIRSYKNEEIPEEILQTLLDCAMWAPSARNSQVCHVRVLTDKKALEALNVDFKNKVGWDTPAYTRWDTNPVYQGAPALFFIYGETKSDMNGGIMAENIAVAAEGLGLGSCIIGSVGALLDTPDGNKWKRILDIPENFEFIVCVAVGEKDENPAVKPRKPENFRIIDCVDPTML